MIINLFSFEPKISNNFTIQSNLPFINININQFSDSVSSFPLFLSLNVESFPLFVALNVESHSFGLAL